MKKIFVALTLLLLVVSAVGCGGVKTPDTAKKTDTLRIVTSFYPIYIDVLNIAQGVPNVEVVNMTKPQTGCLHDYQLTTDDMRLLESADIFVANGGGMENFLTKVAGELPNLKTVEAANADSIVMLKVDGEENPHVWMSVTYALAEVKEITARLCEYDPANADAYRKNAMDYCMKLERLREDMHAKLDDLPNKDIVTFHEAFPYFAREFKLNIVGVIEHEPGEEPSPKELADIVDKVNAMPVKVLFVEPQYSPKAAQVIAEETGAKIYSLDPIVTGEADETARNAYIERMTANADELIKALR